LCEDRRIAVVPCFGAVQCRKREGSRVRELKRCSLDLVGHQSGLDSIGLPAMPEWRSIRGGISEDDI